MGFDASKLVVGKKYPTRDGKPGRYLGELQGHMDHRFVFATTGPNEASESVSVHAGDGRFSFHYVTSGRDIISDEPIKEPVEVKVAHRYVAVFSDGEFGLQYASMEDAVMAEKNHPTDTIIGVYELPEKILVTPK